MSMQSHATELAIMPATTRTAEGVSAARDDSLTMTPRRILFVDHTASMGGGEIALLNLVQRFDPKRYHPIVVLFSDGPLAKHLENAGVETHVLPLDDSVLNTRKDRIGFRTLLKVGVVLRALRQVWRLRRFIRRSRIDLVHANSLKADIIAGIASRLAGVEVLWHVRDRITNDYLPKPVVIAFRRLSRWIPTCVVANSDATLGTLQLNASKRTATIYSGIALDPHATSNGPAMANASQAPIIGLVGRITWWKGQDIFIHAAAKVLEKFPNARFQIIGAALFSELEYEHKIKALPRELSIENAVEFLGFRSDTPDLIARLDLLVHASTTGEPFGQVIVEGMAAGKAVVATNGGGVPEIVVDGQTGLLVPMGDASAMADAICALLADPALASRMGQRGHQRVIERFTVERSAAQVQDLYDSLLARECASRVEFNDRN
jgi:glycosyltransferase involved in cell wall biosynthesis